MNVDFTFFKRRMAMIAFGLGIYPFLAWVAGRIMCPAFGLRTPSWGQWFLLALLVIVFMYCWGIGKGVMDRARHEERIQSTSRES